MLCVQGKQWGWIPKRMTLGEGICKGEESVLMSPARCIGICPVPVTGLYVGAIFTKAEADLGA